MPRFPLLLAFTLIVTTLFASDLQVKVVDPQGAVVAAARVSAYPAGSNTPGATAETRADGVAQLAGLAEGTFQIRVLAPGFAPAEATLTFPAKETAVVHLALASAATTVVVSAERTPLPLDESTADTSQLDARDLTAMQPVAASDAIRFLPGAIVAVSGQRGGLASLFVRGGDSRYNKVIIDGVPVNDPGGTFDFSVIPMDQVERMEFVRGAESTLYGSDAMTSVVQFWSRTGSTRMPELRFGADGGTFGTAHGYASLAGARGRFDYNLFGDQFTTGGQGANDDYSNSSQGANVGVVLAPRVTFRLRARHANERTGVPSFWSFNGQPLLPPDTDQRARQNNFLASAELTFTSTRWQHRFTGFEYHHRRLNVDTVQEAGRVSPSYGNIDYPFSDYLNVNRAGFDYQGEYDERSWARTTVGYNFEDENGFVGDLTYPPLGHGLRLNQAAYVEQIIAMGRLSLVGGVRFVHNTTFGNKAVPRAAASFAVLKGGKVFSGTRLRFSYATGIKEPRLEEAFGIGGFNIIPNPNLQAEQNRAFEAGVQQSMFAGKGFVSATYFNNLFTNQIAFSSDPVTYVAQYVNLNRALAHGAEVEI
ncbi:MAG: TonB-dependent receptor, partial [Terriglobales bacterium]